MPDLCMPASFTTFKDIINHTRGHGKLRLTTRKVKGPPKWSSISATILVKFAAIYLLIYHLLLFSLLLLFTILARKFPNLATFEHHLGGP